MSARQIVVPAALVLALAGCATNGAEKAQAQAQAERAQARKEIARADPVAQIAFWTQEWEANKADITAAKKLIVALRTIGQSKRAAEVALEGLARAPNDATLMSYGAIALLENGQGAQAAPLFIALAGLDPMDAEARVGLGLAFDQSGRHPEAQEAYRAALEIDPDHVGALTNLGASLLISGKPGDARGPLERAAALRFAPPQARQNLVVAYALTGRFDAAEALARVDLPPHVAAENLAYLRGLSGDQRRWSDLAD